MSQDETEVRLRQVERDVVELRAILNNSIEDIREIKMMLIEQKRMSAQFKLGLFTTAGSAIIMLLSTIFIFLKG